jgi:hypothetical protein
MMTLKCSKIVKFSGHMIIPYYKQQKEEKERREMERLRVRCQSYVEAGTNVIKLCTAVIYGCS